jgi:hypothetical protein
VRPLLLRLLDSIVVAVVVDLQLHSVGLAESLEMTMMMSWKVSMMDPLNRLIYCYQFEMDLRVDGRFLYSCLVLKNGEKSVKIVKSCVEYWLKLAT